MSGNYIWPFIVLYMLATCNTLQQGSPSGLSIEPFPAIETFVTPDLYNTKVQHSSTKVVISTGYSGYNISRKTSLHEI